MTTIPNAWPLRPDGALIADQEIDLIRAVHEAFDLG